MTSPSQSWKPRTKTSAQGSPRPLRGREGQARAAAAMLPIDDDLSDDDLNEALWNQPRYTVPGFQKGQ